MKSLRLTVIVAAVSLTLASACATDDPNRRAKTGAAVGAVAGGVLGHQAHSKNGRYVGAVVGALTGAAVGNYMDKQQRELENKLANELRNNQVSVTRLDDNTLKLDVRSEASFNVNSADIQPDFQSSLNSMAGVIGEFDQTAVHVIGHTDSTGSDSYNQQLSEKRATAVTRFLSKGGVDRTRMRFSGKGESLPVADNASSAGRSQNRRVEIYLKPIVEGNENEAYRSPI